MILTFTLWILLMVANLLNAIFSFAHSDYFADVITSADSHTQMEIGTLPKGRIH